MRATHVGTYCGCSIGTSKINSGGMSKISGSSPLACNTSGSTSKRPYFGVHPSRIQSCEDQTFSGITEHQTKHFVRGAEPGNYVCIDTGAPSVESVSRIILFFYMYVQIHLCELHAGRVSTCGSIWHLIACIL